jgi:hypothetical protein
MASGETLNEKIPFIYPSAKYYSLGFFRKVDNNDWAMRNLRRVSFGGTAAIVTNMALVIGLEATAASKASVIGGLLIIAVADNLTDSLSIHMYQESERLESRTAFAATLSNFITRFAVSMSFVAIIVFLPVTVAPLVCFVWGMFLLGLLTYFLALERKVNVTLEILKHAFAALAVIAVAKAIGAWIRHDSG